MSRHKALACLALRHGCLKVLGCGRHNLQHAPIEDFFLSNEEYDDKKLENTNVHHISNSTVNINSSPDVLMGVINNQKAMLDQQAEQIRWLRDQVQLLTKNYVQQ